MTDQQFEQAQALMAQGHSQREAAKRLDIPESSLRYRLKRQGLVVQRPPAPPAAWVPPAEHAPPATPAMTFVAVPEFQEMLELLRNLNARVEGLEQARGSPALPAAPATAAPPAPPAAERKEIMQWTVRLSKALIEHVKAVSYERRLNPSELVEEWLWEKAHDQPKGES